MDIQAYIASGTIERYALGLCSPEELTELETLSQNHAEIMEEVLAIRTSLEAYALKHAKEPPPEVKQRVMEKIHNPESTRIQASQSKVRILNRVSETPRQTQKNYFNYAAAASLVLLLSSAALNYILYSNWRASQNELAQLVNEKNFVASQLGTQRASYVQALKDLDLLKNPNVLKMEMKGMPQAPDAKALVLMDSKTNEIFLDIKKLPTPPDSMQYQFWAIVAGKPIDAGMIELCPATDTCGIHKMNTIPDARAFAISLERKGGNLQPKGQIYASYGI